MTILTVEQQEQLKNVGGQPLHLFDPQTSQEYVLLPIQVYQHFQTMLDDIDPRELYPLLHRALRDEGWDDPQMDEYNQYG